ncbi:MAG TPA: hypothetical protein VGE93_11925, partial [Bryobacteraceae bacterium]
MSLHRTNVPVPEIRLGAQAARVERTAGLAGAVGILLCLAAFFFDRNRLFQSYLFAFTYWGGFAIGGLGVLLMNNVVGGRWGVTTRQFLIGAVRTLPLILILFIPLLFGLGEIYPWARPDLVKNSAFLQHKQGYLNV